MQNSTIIPENNIGLVISKHGIELIIEDSNGLHIRCIPRKKLPPIVSGDFVKWEKLSNDQGVVTALNPRTTLLSRPNNNGKVKPIAANISQMLIVCAIKPDYDFSLIDNYLVAAELLKITPILVINKIDLLNSNDFTNLKNKFSCYDKLNYQLYFTSILKSNIMKSFTKGLDKQTSIFVGQSGVGKSSLINFLLPNLNLKTRALNNSINLGKHTTSSTTLYHLPSSGSIIDSPGVREFKLWNINHIEAAWSFPEFRPFINLCKFRDCVHLKEPGCAVKAAIEKNKITERRYQSYKRILSL
ncbi:MAG: ribosome small subunit-dependent GTPase A [Thiohalomonadales bacterium]